MQTQKVQIKDLQYKYPLEINDEAKEKIDLIYQSLAEIGLLHPITINAKNEVISGRKRVEALKKAGEVSIDCIVRDSAESEESLHIYENLARYNLTWHEKVLLIKRRHELRQLEHGIAKDGRPVEGKKSGWSIRDTAEELGMAFGGVSEDIRLAGELERDPSLKKIGDRETAKRVILGKLKRASQEAEASQEIIYNKDSIIQDVDNIYLGSAEEILKLFPDNFFNAVVTDPPWLKFIDPKLTRDKFTLDVFKEVFRVMKHDSFLYMVVSTMDFYDYRTRLPEIGFGVQEFPLIWIKEGHLTRGKRISEYNRDYEPILVAWKGSPALSASMLSSVISCKIVPSVHLIHPNEKPIALIKKLLSHCSYENAVVLDPFAGSGVLGVAAVESNRHYVLIERNEEFYQKIKERLKK